MPLNVLILPKHDAIVAAHAATAHVRVPTDDLTLHLFCDASYKHGCRIRRRQPGAALAVVVNVWQPGATGSQRISNGCFIPCDHPDDNSVTAEALSLAEGAFVAIDQIARMEEASVISPTDKIEVVFWSDCQNVLKALRQRGQGAMLTRRLLHILDIIDLKTLEIQRLRTNVSVRFFWCPRECVEPHAAADDLSKHVRMIGGSGTQSKAVQLLHAVSHKAILSALAQASEILKDSSQKEDAQMEDAQIENAQIKDGQIENVQMEDAQIEDGQIEGTQIEDAQIEDAQIEDGQIENAQMEDAQIENAQIKDGQIENVQMEDAQIEGGQIEGAQIEDAQIEDGQIKDAQIEDAHIKDDQGKANQSTDISTPITDTTDGYGIIHSAAHHLATAEREMKLAGIKLQEIENALRAAGQGNQSVRPEGQHRREGSPNEEVDKFYDAQEIADHQDVDQFYDAQEPGDGVGVGRPSRIRALWNWARGRPRL